MRDNGDPTAPLKVANVVPGLLLLLVRRPKADERDGGAPIPSPLLLEWAVREGTRCCGKKLAAFGEVPDIDGDNTGPILDGGVTACCVFWKCNLDMAAATPGGRLEPGA